MKQDFDFSELDVLKVKLDKKRPIEVALYNKIKQKFHLDWTYHSNAIEGNTLSFSETQFYLRHGLTSKGHTLSEYLESKNHSYALEYLEQVVQEKEFLSERLIKDLHAMLFKRNETYTMENEKGEKITKNVLPGKYKQEDNYVLLPDGTKKNYVSFLKVQEEMEKLIADYNQKKDNTHPILLASEIHARFVSIHPFVDGNGRTARLIMNIVLMQEGYAPAIIKNEFKQDYYEALQVYDKDKNLALFVHILEREVIDTLSIMLRAVEGKTILDKEDIGKRINHFGKNMEALDKDIGKFSKITSKEEKQSTIRSIREYLYNLSDGQIGGLESDLYEFKTRNRAFGGIFHNFEIEQLLKDKNIIHEMSFTDNISISNDYLDEDSSGVEITIDPKRAFIPISMLTFIPIPTKYTICICVIIEICPLSKDKEEGIPECKSVNFIQNGVLWEDWHKEDIDAFFIESFETFLSVVEQESAIRKEKFDSK